ncbi:MAG: hypothetical protein RL754_1340 [Bacteroidota bacterium]|jgi:hypothetical protein
MKRALLLIALFWSLTNSAQTAAQIIGPAQGFPADPVISAAYEGGILYLGTQGSGVYELRGGVIEPSERFSELAQRTIYGFSQGEELEPQLEGEVAAHVYLRHDFETGHVTYTVRDDGLHISYNDAVFEFTREPSKVWMLDGLTFPEFPQKALVFWEDGRLLLTDEIGEEVMNESKWKGLVFDADIWLGKPLVSTEVGLFEFNGLWKQIPVSIPVFKVEVPWATTPLGKIKLDKLLSGHWSPDDFSPTPDSPINKDRTYFDVDTVGHTYYGLKGDGLYVFDNEGLQFVIGPERGFPPHKPSYVQVLDVEGELVVATNQGRWSVDQSGAPNVISNFNVHWFENGLEVEDLHSLGAAPSAIGFNVDYLRTSSAPVYGFYRLNEGPWEPFSPEEVVLIERPAPGKLSLEISVGTRLDREGHSQMQTTVSIVQVWYKRVGIWAVAAIALVLVVYIWQRGAKRRVEERLELQERLAEAELASKRLQMNPHFLFNALDAISNFIFSNQPKEAVSYMGKLAKLMRLTLDGTRSSAMVLADEIELVHQYIALAQLRYGQFHFELQLDKNLDEYDTQIPPMLIQPLLENAVQYAMRPQLSASQPALLTLSFTEQNGLLLAIIEDNGPGFDAMAASSASHGLSIVKERLELLQKKTGEPFEMKIESPVNAHSPWGTRVSLILGRCIGE